MGVDSVVSSSIQTPSSRCVPSPHPSASSSSEISISSPITSSSITSGAKIKVKVLSQSGFKIELALAEE